jgi:hypothetical protein
VIKICFCLKIVEQADDGTMPILRPKWLEADVLERHIPTPIIRDGLQFQHFLVQPEGSSQKISVKGKMPN